MKNLDDHHIKKIDIWLGEYNTRNPDNIISNEERCFRFFDNIITGSIQINDTYSKPSKKESAKTAYDLLEAIANLTTYYQKKYDKMLKPLTEGLTFDIAEIESRQERNSPIGQGQVLEATHLVEEWEQLTNTEPLPDKDGDFNTFLTLLYTLRDPNYSQKNHELLITHAIKMHKRIHSQIN
ncbi:MAG: hypothetical protein ACJ0BW_02035 [Pontiellaceae bacterium]